LVLQENRRKMARGVSAPAPRHSEGEEGDAPSSTPPGKQHTSSTSRKSRRAPTPLPEPSNSPVSHRSGSTAELHPHLLVSLVLPSAKEKRTSTNPVDPLPPPPPMPKRFPHLSTAPAHPSRRRSSCSASLRRPRCPSALPWALQSRVKLQSERGRRKWSSFEVIAVAACDRGFEDRERRGGSRKRMAS
jgi:hypothetical protein